MANRIAVRCGFPFVATFLGDIPGGIPIANRIAVT